MLNFSTPRGNESCTLHISLIPLTVHLRCLMGFHCNSQMTLQKTNKFLPKHSITLHYITLESGKFCEIPIVLLYILFSEKYRTAATEF